MDDSLANKRDGRVFTESEVEVIKMALVTVAPILLMLIAMVVVVVGLVTG